jgi:hypothetical protein
MDVFVPEASSSRSASPAPKAAEAPADDPPEVVPSDEDMQQDELLLSAFPFALLLSLQADLTRLDSAVPASLPRRLSRAVAQAQRHMPRLPPLNRRQDVACCLWRSSSGDGRIRQCFCRHSCAVWRSDVEQRHA